VADKKDEKKKKKRRIKGDAFWKLKGFEKKIQKVREELSEWELNKSEELKLYPDQINWATGAIFDPKAEIQDGRVVNAQVIERLAFDVLREHMSITEKLKKIDDEMVEYRDKLSAQLSVWPDMINLSTGIIADDNYEAVDPEKVDEPKDEPEPVEEKDEE